MTDPAKYISMPRCLTWRTSARTFVIVTPGNVNKMWTANDRSHVSGVHMRLIHMAESGRQSLQGMSEAFAGQKQHGVRELKEGSRSTILLLYKCMCMMGTCLIIYNQVHNIWGMFHQSSIPRYRTFMKHSTNILCRCAEY